MFREQRININKVQGLMKEQLDIQRQNWNRYSQGWKKWDELIMGATKPVGDELMNTLSLRGNERVLDVASGTGEPGLSIGRKLPAGEVVGTDLSEMMVLIANVNAVEKGIRNYRSEVGDASSLPFVNGSFDHAVCRFGVMFFPDMDMGVGEMVRVVKPGGRVSIAVWAAPELNPFITVMASVIMEKMGIAPPAEDTPGIFRCAKPGHAADLLRIAGLREVSEFTVNGHAGFESPEHYWDVMSDVAGPLMKALESAPEEKVAEIRDAVLSKASGFRVNGKVHAGWEAILATGIKPRSI